MLSSILPAEGHAEERRRLTLDEEDDEPPVPRGRRSRAFCAALVTALFVVVGLTVWARLQGEAPAVGAVGDAPTSQGKAITSTYRDGGDRHRGAASTSASDSCASSFHMLHLGVCHCKCVLVDVGLNTGTSLTQWAPAAAPLAGPHAHTMSACVRSASTCYYGFEANPVFTPRLIALETSLRANGTRVKLFTRTAFNVNSQPVTMFIEKSTRAGSDGLFSDSFAQGSTLEGSKVHKFIDKSGTWRRAKGNPTVEQKHNKEIVNSMDAATFLEGLRTSSSFVALKLDVEGFEYTLLPHLLMNAPRALCGALSVLAAEWHESMVPKFQGSTDHLKWMLQHRACNITTINWH